MSASRLVSSRVGKTLLKNKFANISETTRRGYHYAEKGGTYRLMIPPPPYNNIQWKCVRATSTFVWTWVFYNLWYEPEFLLGHIAFQPPDPSTFTDEELGIPPDDEDIGY